MTKVVLNCTYGGFGLTKEAFEWLVDHDFFNTPALQKEKEQIQEWFISGLGETGNPYPEEDLFKRDDPLLVRMVEEIGNKASKYGTHLCVLEEKGTLDKDFFISSYDGYESIVWKSPFDDDYFDCEDLEESSYD